MSARAAAIAVAISVWAAAAPAAAGATVLLGGREQASVARAFATGRGDRGRAIVAILGSTVDPAWAAVRSVVPDRGGGVSPAAPAPRVQTSYYVRTGRVERPGSPPVAVRAELSRPFAVAIVYSGSGSESVAYDRTYTSACAGQGGFTDQETETVSPMTWTVRWVVDLDNVLAAVGRGSRATLVPSVSFDAAASRVNAVESVQRTLQDAGCNGNPQTLACTRTFRAGGADPAGALTLLAGGGIEAAIPLAAASAGACDPGAYTLGQSLWDAGAATALAPRLGLLGGRLPADPYAPVRVSWPSGAAASSLGFATGPCAGAGPVCTDLFAWRATVRIEPVGRG